MALVMAPMPAGARSAPQANSANGITEFTTAMPAMRSHSPGVNCARACHRNGSRTSAPRRQACLHQREGAELPRRDAHEQERAAPDRAEQGQFDGRAPGGFGRGGGARRWMGTSEVDMHPHPAVLAADHHDRAPAAPDTRSLRWCAAAHASACPKSSISSSVASMPTDRRSSASLMPRRARSSADRPACEVRGGPRQQRLHAAEARRHDRDA